MRRALDTLGSAESLAVELGVSVVEVETWLSGSGDPPPGAFLRAIDIVARGSSRSAES